MDVKNMANEDLAEILNLYIIEIQKTKITRLDNKGRLFCLDEHRSPHSHTETCTAADELLKRGITKIGAYKASVEKYLRARNRHDKWHGILCQQIIKKIIATNGGTLPAEYLAVAE
ncbi:MAG: hypothetical protein CMF60_03355 [Magnetococcales bacterium]|nr:hypothetical protein [Magnetococcales bacterium]|tara:strand:+ start:19358 stop:19705 length:348 start_codon:yes stop_codon:yes gene_type:complete